MSEEKTEQKAKVEEIKTVEELKQELKATQIALNKARAVTKQKFRIETTQTSNNFHISFNQLFTTEQIKTDYKDLILEENDKEIVCSVALKDKLKDRIINALNQ